MSKTGLSFLNSAVLSAQIKRWARIARKAGQTDLAVLRRQSQRALELKYHLDKLIHIADDRLGMPRVGSSALSKPHNADWAWRPGLWRGRLPNPGLTEVDTKSRLGEEVTLFHDCERSELTLRQIRNLREEDLAPFGLRMDVFQFDGSFLSLAVDIPPEGVKDLKKTHIYRMDTILELEKPLEIFARLNIRNGPNTEQIVKELPLVDDHHRVEFDLAYSNLNEKRVERAWVDFIFEGPQMNQVIVRDLTFTRRPRAQI